MDNMRDTAQQAQTCRTVCTAQAQDMVSIVKTWYGEHGSYYMGLDTFLQDVASVDLGYRCRALAAGTIPHKFM